MNRMILGAVASLCLTGVSGQAMAQQAMPAAADYDHVIDFLRGRGAPHALPVFMVAERVLEEAEARIALHSHCSSCGSQR